MAQATQAGNNPSEEATAPLHGPSTTILAAEEESSSAYRGVAALWFMTVASRVLGVLRDNLQARFIYGWAMDAFVLGLTVQNMFRSLLGEGTLQAVVIPAVVKRLKKADRVAANRLVRGVATRTLIYTGVVSIAVSLVLYLSGFAASGDGAAKLRYMSWMFPYGPLICLSGALAAGLNAYRHFAIPALTPVIMNVCLIAGLVLVGVFGNVYLMIGALVLSGFLEAAVLAPLCNREGIALKPVWSDDTGEVRAVFKGVVPLAIAVAVFQINVLADRIIATILIPGHAAVSSLYLAHRLIHLPLALFGINFATVLLPRVASLHEDNVPGKVEKAVLDAMRMVVFLALPSAAGIAVTALPISVFLYWGGKLALTPEAMPRIVWAVVFYSPAIVFYSLAAVLSRVFYARGDVRTPALCAVLAALTNIVLDVVLVLVMERTLSAGEGGLALASSISGLILMAALLWKMVPKGTREGLLMRLAGGLLASGATTAILWMRFLPWLCAKASINDDAAMVGMSLACGTAVFLIVCLPAAGHRLVADEQSAARMFSSMVRITLSVIPTAAFAFLVARSIPPERLGFWTPMWRAVSPVVLGAFAYWLLIGIFGVAEYDELRAIFERKKGAGADRSS